MDTKKPNHCAIDDDISFHCAIDDNNNRSTFRIDLPKKEIKKDIFLARKDIEILRTYDASMKSEFTDDLTDYVRHNEVIVYLLRKSSHSFEDLARHINIRNAKIDLKKIYYKIYEFYKTLAKDSLIQKKEMVDCYIENCKEKLNTRRMEVKNSVLTLNTHFNRQAVDIFRFIKEIYGARSGIGLKLTEYLNGSGKKYWFFSDESGRYMKQFIIAYRSYNNNEDKGKFLRLTFDKHIRPLLLAYRDSIGKVKKFFNYLDDSELREPIATFLTFGQVSGFLRTVISSRWRGLSTVWVRNTLVGWRRKLEKSFPKNLQLDKFNRVYHTFGDYLRKFKPDTNLHKVISTLERYKMLHLLNNTDYDFDFILNSLEAKKGLDIIRTKNFQEYLLKFNKNELFKHSVKITYNDLENAISTFLDHVNESLNRLENENRKNTETFKNKIEYLRDDLIENKKIKKKYTHIFEHYFAGQQFTKAFAKILESNSIKYNKLFTALRGIIAFAYSRKYNYFGNSGIVKKLNGFDPSKCVTFPFHSPNRTNNKISFVNVYNSPIIFKQNGSQVPIKNFEVVSDKIRAKETDIYLDFPLYKKEFISKSGLITSENRTRTFSRLLFCPTKKIIECLNNGADIVSMTIGVPKTPYYKVPLHVVLGSKSRDAFKHPTKYFKLLDKSRRNPLTNIKSTTLGSDFNELGEYALSVGTPKQQLDITSLARQLGFVEIKKKLEKYRNRIANYQKEIFEKYSFLKIPLTVKNTAERLLRAEKNECNENNIRMKIIYTESLFERVKSANFVPKSKNYKKENPPPSVIIIRNILRIQLLQKKAQRIYKNFGIKFVMLFAYVGRKIGARNFGWDDISKITTKSLRGKLAQIVTYLPRADGLKGLFNEWLEDIYGKGNFKIFEPSPYTSSICGCCGKKSMKKVGKLTSYCSDSNCTKYRQNTNRHQNASQINAQKVVELNVSLPTNR
ncbi:MAG: hypothetical protein KGD74_02470 [Candidatus Lokiarchaeota archaeon]|nr:hypothetical protein [Candidatus Lokiarchaeota archaeon]